MDTISILKDRFSKISQNLQFLIQENKRLKAQIQYLKEKNDVLNRKSEDLILSINNKLKNEDKN
jgi:regulator of replication initiation timing